MIDIASILLSFPTDFTGLEGQVLPIVFAALLLDVAIVVIWYFSGVALNNENIRESAKGEYYQFLGTVILVIIVIWGLTTYSSLSYTILGSTKLLSPTAIGTMCSNIENTSKLVILGHNSSFLSGANTTGSNSLVGICSMLNGSTVTDKINYPLAAAAVVTANLTNQDASNLNSAFIFDSYIGFLQTLNPSIALCFAPEDEGLQCILPGAAVTGGYFRVSESYAPYAGYTMIYSGLSVLGTLLNNSVQSFIAQMLLITIILFIWPYLFFFGIVLRSTFFTRALGGLLIAIAIGAVAIYPTIFGIEYLTLGHGLGASQALGNVSSVNSTYGFNSVTGIPGNALITNSSAPGYYYNLSFFVMPNLQTIAQVNGCWPQVSSSGLVATLLSPAQVGLSAALSSGNGASDPLITAELSDVFYLLNPITNIGSSGFSLISQLGGGYPAFYLPAYCPPQGALTTLFQMLDAYGIIGVSAYFLPIINLIITLSGIVGLSGLMGGNTSLEGLSRFV